MAKAKGFRLCEVDKAMVKWSIRPETPWFNADPLASLDDREIGIWFKQFEEIVLNAK